MAIGTVILLVLSAISGEHWALPVRASTWFWFLELTLVGSIGLFMLYLFVLKKWTASGASYQFVLMPLVTIFFAGLLAGERFGLEVALGGSVVLAGVYVRALSGDRPTLPAVPEEEALIHRCTAV